MAILFIHDDQGNQLKIPLLYKELYIGRDGSNHLKLDEKNISRKHAVLRKNAGDFYVEDLQSYNGVQVNGKRVFHKTHIFHGDIVEIGDFYLEILETTNNTIPSESKETTVQLNSFIPFESNSITFQEPSMDLETTHPEPERAATGIIRLESGDMPDVSSSAASDMATPGVLLGVSENIFGQKFILQNREMIIGRDDDCDINIPHPSISRYHCLIRNEDGIYRIYDTQSSNGVFVNGEKYTLIELSSEDIIQIGHLRLKFFLNENSVILPSAPLEEGPEIREEGGAQENENTLIIKSKPQKGGGLQASHILIFLALIGAAVLYLKPTFEKIISQYSSNYETKQQVQILDARSIQAQLAPLLFSGKFNVAIDLVLSAPPSLQKVFLKQIEEEKTYFVFFEKGQSYRKLSNPYKAFHEFKSIPPKSIYYPSAQAELTPYSQEIEEKLISTARSLSEKENSHEAIDLIRELSWLKPLGKEHQALINEIREASQKPAEVPIATPVLEEQIKVLTEIKTLLKAGDEDKALNILNLNLSKELTNPADFYLTRAKILLKRGQNSEALKDFEAFIQNSPKHPEASSVQEKIEGLKDKLKK